MFIFHRNVKISLGKKVFIISEANEYIFLFSTTKALLSDKGSGTNLLIIINGNHELFFFT